MKMTTRTLMITLMMSLSSILISIRGDDFDSRSSQEAYLMKYAYLGETQSDPRMASLQNNDDKFTRAIMNFQASAGLPMTGIVDEKTKRLMATPRCGVTDKFEKRKKRYAIQGVKWKNTHLTYRINQYTRNTFLSRNTVDSVMKKAFSFWQNASRLTFAHSPTSNVDIDISFERTRHMNCDSFDGRGGTLAHAYFPEFGGDVHFDDDEIWTDKNTYGTNLLQVAVHEIGHSLGLKHSDIEDSIMYPFYQPYDPNFKLEPDDIAGIQRIYGEPRTPPELPPQRPTPPPPRTPSTKPPGARQPTTLHPKEGNLCSLSSIDAIISLKKLIIIFKGNKYYLMEGHGSSRSLLDSDYVHKLFPGFNGLTVKAAYVHDNSLFDNWVSGNSLFGTSVFGTYVYLVDNLYVWKYRMRLDRKFELNEKKYISEKFVGLPTGTSIDGAFVLPVNNKLYVFSGSDYYRVSLSSDIVDSDYPRSIAKFWPGVPANIDAVFSYNPISSTIKATTFFFKGRLVYTLDHATFEVSFPRTFTSTFLGCSYSNRYARMENGSNNPNDFIGSDGANVGNSKTGPFFLLSIFSIITLMLIQ